MAKIRNRRYVSYTELIELLCGIDHAIPIGVVTATEPKMRKTNNEFYGRVTKITESNVFTNVDYAAAVNRQREREGATPDFTAAQRAFGDRIRVNGRPTCVIEYDKKDGQHVNYLEVHFYGHLKTESRYLLDGRTPIDKSEFREFLQIPAKADRQALETDRIVRTYDIRNVIEVRINGVDYVQV